MSKTMFKSRKWKKQKLKVPGGRTVTHFRKPKPNIARCGNCGKPLHGIPRARQSEMKKFAKTEKRPERPYGGVLCSNCMRKSIATKARSL
ncbi:MAG: 50S ribosomal protein L34e [Candidatus Aenigmarchaeota archaeon]|nr:50S ribosomal protein L34e [Candidatus Aenigmarchaeota archaeon]